MGDVALMEQALARHGSHASIRLVNEISEKINLSSNHGHDVKINRRRVHWKDDLQEEIQSSSAQHREGQKLRHSTQLWPRPRSKSTVKSFISSIFSACKTKNVSQSIISVKGDESWARLKQRTRRRRLMEMSRRRAEPTKQIERTNSIPADPLLHGMQSHAHSTEFEFYSIEANSELERPQMESGSTVMSGSTSPEFESCCEEPHFLGERVQERSYEEKSVSLMTLLQREDGIMVSDDEDEKNIETVWEEAEEKFQETVCCVCMVEIKGAAFVPCGHTFCRNCSRKVWRGGETCPLCNSSIHQDRAL